MSPWLRLFVCLLMIGGLAGCGQAAPAAQGEESAMPEPTPDPPAALTPQAGGISAESPPIPPPPAGSYQFSEPFPALVQRLVDGARADLAGRLQIAADAIAVAQVDGVVWPDRSLGCPQPGRAYQQVGVDGTRIMLRAVGQLYAYHSGESQPAFLCAGKGGA